MSKENMCDELKRQNCLINHCGMTFEEVIDRKNDALSQSSEVKKDE